MKTIWQTFVDQSYLTDVEVSSPYIRWENGKAYLWSKNSHSGAVADGDAAFDVVTSSTRVGAVQLGASGTALSTLRGIWNAAVAVDSYGWVQIYGYKASISQLGHASSAAGVSLKGVSGQQYLTYGAAAGAAPLDRNHVLNAVAYTTTTTTSLVAGFIRCL